ncbi:ADP-ribosylglycohydrolase family protein [Paenibacillus nanensis]|uniref:ADP-ribosylglycohydrolase family protein n=1 Tax=Paenibacillus nanensis TaxID=393251 RepID=A0A3A1VJK3_9BACL|nr:ADP-ribosylglycohydrolase family protein [Paenibacillus nanensis]RIX60631.1 ADP-ribosylglycohydrolase family protein [Paenibacillus nanensis]
MTESWRDDSKSFLRSNMKKKVLPTFYGGIIGDMLGVPVEFKKRGTFRIEGVTGYGTYNQPPGTWSDDSSLTLCTIESIVENENADGLMRKFVKYAEEGYWTPFDRMFDIGIATNQAVSRFRDGLPAEACGGKGEYDNGNGALMRIAPAAFLLIHHKNFAEKAEIIKSYTEITHAHPRSIVGSILYVELLIRLYHNATLQESLAAIKSLFNEHYEYGHSYERELAHYARIFDAGFFSLPEQEIKSDGYVVHSLEAAIWCAGSSGSFREAVLKAVNLGDDTDTVGFIAGTLSGIMHGMEGIPAEWLSGIVRKDKIDALLERFYLFCADAAE